MRIAVIGSGYVGLVSGACFSSFGFDVTCVDKDHGKIEKLKQAYIPIYEPGLEELVQSNMDQKRLRFTSDLTEAVPEADAVFIAVGTPPSRRGEGHADLSYVFAVAQDIAPHLRGYTAIVAKSTVPVGTGRKIHKIIQDSGCQAEFDCVSNPEFLREGSALEDFMRPNRVVIGCESEQAQKIMAEIYRPLYLFETPIVWTDLETAELIKYASNAFLATKITFINEMANLCEKVGADIHGVAKGMGLDQRIGSKFLHPGPGYGGSCFPKDTEALVATGQDYDVDLRIVRATIQVNQQRPFEMVHKIIQAMGGDISKKTIGVLGLTFKPNTDDMRDAPSLMIVPELQNKGANIKAFDPKGMEEARRLLNHIDWQDHPYAVVENADALVVLTEWNEFRALDFNHIYRLMRTPNLIDLRNIYQPEDMRKIGFNYVSVGRP